MPFALCTVAAAPMRKEPSHRTEMTNQILFGEVVEIIEEKEEWLLVKCVFDGYEGWVTHHLVEVTLHHITSLQNDYVSSGLLNEVKQDNQLFQIPMGCPLAGFNENTKGLWKEGLLYKGSYRKSSEVFEPKLFQNLMLQWHHAPYLWGGKTFMGVDCSGFVQTVFRVIGVPLLRDAYQQATQGEAIDLSAASTGDVAFFNNDAGKIIHVGVVWEQGKIIHASGTVRIDDLNTKGIFKEGGKQTHQFHSVRRMIKSMGF